MTGLMALPAVPQLDGERRQVKLLGEESAALVVLGGYLPLCWVIARHEAAIRRLREANRMGVSEWEIAIRRVS